VPEIVRLVQVDPTAPFHGGFQRPERRRVTDSLEQGGLTDLVGHLVDTLGVDAQSGLRVGIEMVDQLVVCGSTKSSL